MCADFARQGAKKQPSPKPQEESEPQPAHTQTGSIVSLQRLVGNQGVQHLVSEGRIQRHRSGADLPPLPGVARHRSAEREQDAEEQEGENEEAPVTILGVQAVSATSPSDKGKILIATSAPVEHLQRAPKGAVGGGISTTGAKIAPEVTISTKKSFKYVELEFEGGVSGEVEVTWSETDTSVGVEGKGGKGSKEGAIKAKIPVFKKALNDRVKAESEKSIWEELDVESVDVEMEVPKIGSEEEQAATTMGVYLVIKTKGGHEFKPFVNLFNAETKKGETEISGPSAGIEVAIELAAHEWKLPVEGFKSIQGKLQAKGKVGVKPNYTEIAKMAIQRYGAAFTRVALRSIATRFMLHPFTLAGAVTVFAAWAALNDNYDIKETARKAVQASLGYRVGFMTGIGVKSQFSGGDAEWVAHGTGVGAGAMDNIVTQILQEPVMAAFGFTREEISGAIREGVEARKSEFERALYERADPKIKALFVKQWREMKRNSWWGLYPEAYIERDEKYLRTRMGLPIDGDLDESFQGPG